MAALLFLALAALVLAALAAGPIALVKIHGLRRELTQLRETLNLVRPEVRRAVDASPAEAAPAAVSAPPVPPAPERQPAHFPVLQPAAKAKASDAAASHALALEMRLGTHWIIWLGVAVFLGGVALGLKYSYDNNLIGPAGRLLIGVLTGLAALGGGEYFCRRRLSIPFQAFTGGGLAILYLCIFFSFQVYHITDVGLSMLLAMAVTGLAIFLSVAHKAQPIALLAVLGGYLSPVFLSTGQNAPWLFFSYIAMLNLVALGAAFFHRWRALDLFCLGGTALLFQTWYSVHYAYPDQLVPALFFITLFYVMFMATPMVYSLVRGIPEGVNSLVMLVGNSLFWLSCYYNVLYGEHRQALGFVVLGQAALVFGLYLVWVRRVRRETRVAQSLLMISLSLLALVVPLQLRLYAIPIAWAAQGTLVVWLSTRFNNLPSRIGGLAVLALSVCGLAAQWPLHTLPFTPVLNRPFGAWVFVILCLAAAAVIVHRRLADTDWTRPWLAGGLGAAALLLACFLLTVENYLYWELDRGENWYANMTAVLVVLWTVIPGLAVAARRRTSAGVFIAQTAYMGALAMFLVSLSGNDIASERLALNVYFMPRLLFIVALWAGLRYLKPRAAHIDPMAWFPTEYNPALVNASLEIAGHAALALVCLVEMMRWGRETTLITQDMAVGLISAVWAAHACALIWHGLVSREPLRRYAGFLLFAAATGKTVFVDVFNLDAVHRIASWLGVGLLLVIAALLYQRYSGRLLTEDTEGSSHEQDISK